MSGVGSGYICHLFIIPIPISRTHPRLFCCYISLALPLLGSSSPCIFCRVLRLSFRSLLLCRWCVRRCERFIDCSNFHLAHPTPLSLFLYVSCPFPLPTPGAGCLSAALPFTPLRLYFRVLYCDFGGGFPRCASFINRLIVPFRCYYLCVCICRRCRLGFW